jgi:hypothetical protein
VLERSIRKPAFVQAMISAPVIDLHDWMAAHRGCVPAASTKIDDTIFPWLGNKPNAALAPHTFKTACPWINDVLLNWSAGGIRPLHLLMV